MTHHNCAADLEFRRAFEAREIAPVDFDHEAHVRLAYVYLCEHSVEDAGQAMKAALLQYLRHLGVGDGKYHETVTRAWIMAVDYFMSRSSGCQSASEFVSTNPQLLDSKIMLTHYSADVLFSTEARRNFVSPDKQAIPVA